MANNQAFQQTSTHAVMSVAKAIRRINKRSGRKHQPEFIMSDEDKTITEIKVEITNNGWLKRLGAVYDPSGKLVSPSKWTKKQW
eukprot:3098615-Heterocapsa_arctica.AAC.1